MICPNCGNDIPNNAEFCPKCGVNIQKASIEKRNVERRNKIGFGITKVLYIILLFPLIIVFMIGFGGLVSDIYSFRRGYVRETDFGIHIACILIAFGSIIFIIKRLTDKT